MTMPITGFLPGAAASAGDTCERTQPVNNNTDTRINDNNFFISITSPFLVHHFVLSSRSLLRITSYKRVKAYGDKYNATFEDALHFGRNFKKRECYADEHNDYYADKRAENISNAAA